MLIFQKIKFQDLFLPFCTQRQWAWGCLILPAYVSLLIREENHACVYFWSGSSTNTNHLIHILYWFFPNSVLICLRDIWHTHFSNKLFSTLLENFFFLLLFVFKKYFETPAQNQLYVIVKNIRLWILCYIWTQNRFKLTCLNFLSMLKIPFSIFQTFSITYSVCNFLSVFHIYRHFTNHILFHAYFYYINKLTLVKIIPNEGNKW